jgi:hypothetical protein
MKEIYFRRFKKISTSDDVDFYAVNPKVVILNEKLW